RRAARGSAESGRNFFNALPRRRAEALQRRENPFMGHGRAEIRPAVRLKLRPAEPILLLFGQLASGRPRESIEVETDLLLEPRVFPHGDPHVMSSHIGARPRPISALLPSQPSEEIPQLDYGGGGEATRFVCGFLHCDQRFNPLIGALPTMLCVCGRDSARQGEPSEVETAKRPGVVLADADGWLASTLRRTIEEADG